MYVRLLRVFREFKFKLLFFSFLFLQMQIQILSSCIYSRNLLEGLERFFGLGCGIHHSTWSVYSNKASTADSSCALCCYMLSCQSFRLGPLKNSEVSINLNVCIRKWCGPQPYFFYERSGINNINILYLLQTT